MFRFERKVLLELFSLCAGETCKFQCLMICQKFTENKIQNSKVLWVEILFQVQQASLLTLEFTQHRKFFCFRSPVNLESWNDFQRGIGLVRNHHGVIAVKCV